MIASLVTLAGVVGFALSMLIGSNFASYLSSMVIAWGFVPMISSFAAYSKNEAKATSYTAIAFAAIYSTFVILVYFAQLTTVRLENLSTEATNLLNYTQFGLFFNYDLLGYAFMALATFFIAWSIQTQTNGDKWLRGLLFIHGIFAISCVVMPILGLFHAHMQGGSEIGVLALLFWCAYFIPICVLSFLHFKRQL